MIEIITPAGFERFFAEVANVVQAGAFTMEAMADLAARYVLSFGNPGWLPDVVARYGLTVPPAARLRVRPSAPGAVGGPTAAADLARAATTNAVTKDGAFHVRSKAAET